ncbi:hypothetical protein NL108_015190 [Boleophthalmus pectinirostris]|nr:hypothetical protein NL108_015190 [Boleophthalmus pectinirostris]
MDRMRFIKLLTRNKRPQEENRSVSLEKKTRIKRVCVMLLLLFWSQVCMSLCSSSKEEARPLYPPSTKQQREGNAEKKKDKSFLLFKIRKCSLNLNSIHNFAH